MCGKTFAPASLLWQFGRGCFMGKGGEYFLLGEKRKECSNVTLLTAVRGMTHAFRQRDGFLPMFRRSRGGYSFRTGIVSPCYVRAYVERRGGVHRPTDVNGLD